MSQDDPFGVNPDKTVIRPNPGGRRPAGTPTPSPIQPPPSAFPDTRGGGSSPASAAVLTETGLNPLASAAGPLLALAARLRATATSPNLDELRNRVVGHFREFEQKVSRSDLPRDALRAGHYALCATIDDVIMNTPWGGGGQWARSTIAGMFHNDHTGGEKFFEFLTAYQRDVGRYGDVLELMYLCLSLGFEGRLRVAQRGSSEWSNIREGLYNLLRQRRGEFERELSPHWRGMEKPHRPLTSFLPAWVTVVAAFAFAAIVYVILIFSINGASDALADRFNGLPPAGKVAIKADTPPPPVVVSDGVGTRLKTFLAPEIRQGLVTVLETPQTATVRISGTDMFPSGQAVVNDRFQPLLKRIAEALDAERGSVRITGYTDNVPIRSVRFPSNYELSLARAAAVRDLIVASSKTRRDMAVAGRADADPIAPNTTPEGRSANRRIEVVLNKEAAP